MYLLFQQEFVSTDTIVVQHDLNQDVDIRIVDDTNTINNNLVDRIEFDTVSPYNKLTVYLKSSASGRVQLLSQEYVNVTTSDKLNIANIQSIGNRSNNVLSTGILTGGELSINVDKTKFNIAAGAGYVVNNYYDPLNPVVKYVEWTEKTEILDSYLSSVDETSIAIDEDGYVVQSATYFTDDDRRDLIILGVSGHLLRTEIEYVIVEPFASFDVLAQMGDFFENFNSFNISGNNFGPNGSNLYLNKTSGKTFDFGSNYVNSKKNPNIFSSDAFVAPYMQYYYRDSYGDWVSGDYVNEIITNKYDGGTGLIDVPSGKWTIQTLFLYAPLELVDVQFGQKYYDTLGGAEASLQEIIELNPFLSYDTFRGWLIVKEGATALNDLNQAKFVSVVGLGTFYMAAGSGASAGSITASNIGVGGVGLYDGKVEVDLRFRNIAGSDKISVTLNDGYKTVDLDVVEGYLSHLNFLNIGTNTHNQIDSHIGSTSNPHSVTASQVGNTIAQWNANKLEGYAISPILPIDGYALVWDSDTSLWKSDVSFPMPHSGSHISSGNDPIADAVSGGASGLMSGSDKLKLDSIESGAQNNTASNYGVGGVGLYDSKDGYDLRFRNINSGSNKISVTLDNSNHEVDIDVIEGYLVHQNLSGAGTNSHSSIDSHISSTSNPHGVTALQVGNTISQWNANKLEGYSISPILPVDGYALVWNNGTSLWEPNIMFPSEHASTHISTGSDPINNVVSGGASGLMSGTDKFLLDAYLPSYNEKNALVGTYGIPSGTNKYVTSTDPRLKHGKTLIVAKSGGDFTSVKAAIESITDASIMNPYVIKVEAGVYYEDPFSLKSFVSVVGQGDAAWSVSLVTTNNSSHFISGAAASSLINVSVTGPSGSGYAAINYSETSPFPFMVYGILIRKGYYGIYCHPSGFGMLNMYEIVPTYLGTNMNKFVYVTDYGRAACFTCGCAGMPPYTLGYGYYVDGPNADLSLDLCSFSVTGGVGAYVDNGAKLRATACSFLSGSNAFEGGSGGSNSRIYISGSTIGESFTYDVKLNTNTGITSFNGVGHRNKLLVPEGSQFSASFTDPTDGYEGQVVLGELWFGTTEYSFPLGTYSKNIASSGLLSGGNISVFSGLQINISEGYGYINNGTIVYDVQWPDSYLTLSSNKEQAWIVVDENGTISETFVSPDETQKIVLGVGTTGSSSIYLLSERSVGLSQYVPKMHIYARDVVGPISVSGCTVTKYATTSLQMSVDSGTYYVFDNRKNSLANSPITFTYWHRDGSGGWTKLVGKTAIDPDGYDDGSGTLASVPSTEYKGDLLYLADDGYETTYHCVYAQETFETSGGVISNPVVPDVLTNNALRLARIVVQSGSNNISLIVDQRPKLGQMASGSTSVTKHGDLTGLDLDDHKIYQLRTEKNVASGYCGLESNSKVLYSKLPFTSTAPTQITVTSASIGTSNEICFSDHVHSIYTETAGSLTVGGSSSEGSATSLARSDHGHGLPAFGITSGTFCQGNDSRLSDARTPLNHNLINTTNHPVSGLTTGHFLKATGATTYDFAAHGLTYTDVGAAATSHAHGNITSAGAIGSTASLPIITTTSGVLTVGSFGSTVGTFCQGNDSRLSDARTPLNHNLINTTNHPVSGLTTGHFLKATGATTYDFAAHGLTYTDVGAAATSHAHGNITSAGAIGSTASLPIITTTSGVLTVGSFGSTVGTFCQGNDSRLSDDRTASGLRSATTVVSISSATAPSVDQFLRATSSTAATWQTVTIPSVGNTNPVDILVRIASPGTSAELSRVDHGHNISVGSPVSVGTANSDGNSTSLSRSNHVHSGLTRDANDFSTFALKATPTTSDILLIEDSAASGTKKYITFSSLRADFNNGGDVCTAARSLGNNSAYDLFIRTNNSNVMRIASTGEVRILGVNGYLYSERYVMGGQAGIGGPDLSLIPIVDNQSVVTTWWGMQLIGNRQANVDYTPVQYGARDDFSVIIPNQQASKIGLVVQGQTGQTGDLIRWRDSSYNVLSKVTSNGLVVAPNINNCRRVRAATTGAITLSGAQTIDGVSVVAGDLVLVKNQGTGSQNGIYVANASTWTYANDWQNGFVFAETYVSVSEGTANGHTAWRVNNTGTITVGTTAIVFTRMFLSRDAGDINSFTEKTTLASSDVFLIEDSADTYNKKKITFSNLPKKWPFSKVLTVDATSANADYSTIQAAINAASAGMTILINPGVYAETISLKSGVDLFGVGGGGIGYPNTTANGVWISRTVNASTDLVTLSSGSCSLTNIGIKLIRGTANSIDLKALVLNGTKLQLNNCHVEIDGATTPTTCYFTTIQVTSGDLTLIDCNVVAAAEYIGHMLDYGLYIGGAGTSNLYNSRFTPDVSSTNQYCIGIGNASAIVNMNGCYVQGDFIRTLGTLNLFGGNQLDYGVSGDPIDGTGASFKQWDAVRIDGSNEQYKLNLKTITGDISSPANGDVWYNNTTGKFRGHENGTSYDLISSTSVFGAGYTFQESTARSTTTSSTYQTKVTLTTPSAAGTYMVMFSCILDNAASQIGWARLYNNTDATTLYESSHRPSNASVDCSVSGFAQVTISGSAKTIYVQYRSDTAGNTTGISYARVQIWRVA